MYDGTAGYSRIYMYIERCIRRSSRYLFIFFFILITGFPPNKPVNRRRYFSRPDRQITPHTHYSYYYYPRQNRTLHARKPYDDVHSARDARPSYSAGRDEVRSKNQKLPTNGRLPPGGKRRDRTDFAGPFGSRPGVIDPFENTAHTRNVRVTPSSTSCLNP